MISIIVPTLNEERTIACCLNQLRRHKAAHEIVVVDGGSTDRTEAVVRGFPDVRLITGAGRGRERQMNSGAKAAAGDILCSCTPTPCCRRAGWA